MAVARFQVVSVARSAHVPVLREPADGAGSWAETPHPRERGFTWRFMAANNRTIAKSAYTSPDVESCLEEIRILRQSLALAVGETPRDGHRQWVWRVRLADEVVATAVRGYPRQVRARMMCNAFLNLVAETAGTAPVRVMYR
ncbi:MAG: hypothetical protein JO364_20380 [Pseudonocardiales bacterium]|nr:hypothetical protein [Pseudonocardiales bacterium]MBV9032610.1 hypothetical protein [Pseudonocardiales bacterium]